VTSYGGPHKDVNHSFICICPLLAASLTGLLGCADELLFSELDCLTVAPTTDTSIGYSREMGRFVLPVAMQILAE